MYTHIYIYIRGPLRPSKMFTYTKIHRPVGPCHIMVQKSAHQPIKTSIQYMINQGPLSHPQLPLPQEEVVAHPYLPQAVEVAHLQDPPAPGGRRPLVMAASIAARRIIDRHGGGNPIHCSRNSSSWIRIHMPSGTSQTPSQIDGVCHPSPLRLRPEGHEMAPHQGHQIGASSPVSQYLQVTPQPHPVRASLHVEVSPLAAPTVYITPPHAREVPNLHMHQTSKQQMISVSIHQTCALVYQNHNINQNI
jgi:hypothetical protein